MREAWVSQFDSAQVPNAGDTACDSGELRGLNPGAVVPPDMDYNVAFAWNGTAGAWHRKWPAHLAVISMVVPDVKTGYQLPARF